MIVMRERKVKEREEALDADVHDTAQQATQSFSDTLPVKESSFRDRVTNTLLCKILLYLRRLRFDHECVKVIQF